jgi:hypothetical protein
MPARDEAGVHESNDEEREMRETSEMRSQIVVRTELLATHQWPGAPPRRAYLASLHAHVFRFEGRAPVGHSDRQIEFHDLRDLLIGAVANVATYPLYGGPPTFGDMSCEQIGEAILRRMPRLSSIVVSEDGQFDAEVIRDAVSQSSFAG